MTLKKLLIAAALVLSATPVLAQDYGYSAYGPGPYAYSSRRSLYDYAPGAGTEYDGYRSYGSDPYRPRGGPGPRVLDGQGMGIGAER